MGTDGEKGGASPRAISGVSPETLFGETPNSTREMLPSSHLRPSASSADRYPTCCPADRVRQRSGVQAMRGEDFRVLTTMRNAVQSGGDPFHAGLQSAKRCRDHLSLAIGNIMIVECNNAM